MKLKDCTHQNWWPIWKLLVYALWDSGGTAILDYRIVNPDAISYSLLDYITILNHHAYEKYVIYDIISEDIRSSFTPMDCPTDAVLHIEFKKEPYVRFVTKWILNLKGCVNKV